MADSTVYNQLEQTYLIYMTINKNYKNVFSPLFPKFHHLCCCSVGTYGDLL